jgi:tetratricopeptide (TPR) repeat protein
MRRVIENIKFLSKARELLAWGKFYDCIELCNKQIESTPNDFYSFFYRGQCKTQLKLYDEAIKDFEIALINADKNVFPKSILEEKLQAEIRIANIYRRQRKTEKALEGLDQIIKNHPNYSAAYIEMAGILADIGKYELALDNINSAIKISPKDKKLIDFRADLVYFMTR